MFQKKVVNVSCESSCSRHFATGATERSTWTCLNSDTLKLAREGLSRKKKKKKVLDCAFYLICALRSSTSTNSFQSTRISIKTIRRDDIRDIGNKQQIWGYRKCQDRMRSK
jgi:hypothetical protein